MGGRPALLVAVFSLAVCGCATVDPEPDFQRANDYVQRSIGLAPSQPDEDAARIDAVVAELLDGGLTCEEAVKIALVNNPGVTAAFQRVGMARADVVQAGLFSNPSLGLSLRLPEGGGLANLEVGLAQNIAELWLIPARRRAAERDLDRTLLETARQVSRTGNDTKLAYFDAVGARQALESSREALRLVEALQRIAQARFDVGAVGALDVNLTRGLVLQAQVDERKNRLAASSARRALATLMGLSADLDVELTEPLPGAMAADRDIEEIVSTALESRLDVRAARDAVAAAQARLEAEYARIWRDIEVGFDLEREERRALPGRKILADTVKASFEEREWTAPDIQSRRERRSARAEDVQVILGPSISLPLPIFDQNQAQIAKADYALSEVRALRDGLEREAAQQTREAYDRAAAGWDLVRLYEAEVLPQARETLELSEAAYQAGSTPIVNVIEAQRSLLDVRRAYVEAVLSASRALVDLERATGRPASIIFGDTDAPESEAAAKDAATGDDS